MRILFSSLGSHGHTFPLVPLAVAASELGHDVTFVTTDTFADALTAQGIEHVTGGMDMLEAFELGNASPAARKTKDFDPRRVSAVFGSILARRHAADLAPIIVDRKPDLVVHEVANVGVALAARAAETPAVCHSFGKYWLPSGPLADIRLHLAEVAAEYGVEVPDGDVMRFGNPYLDICPPSLQDPDFLATATDRISLRPVPFAEPGGLPSWVLEHREPLVYLTLGTAFATVGVLRTAIEGLAGLGAKVLVAVGPTVEVDALGDVPDNVVVVPWLPQADLLPYADLVVHHGGAGTTMGTLGAGVPHLVLPQGADQFGNAAMVTDAGLGDRVLGAEVTAEVIAAKAHRLLTDDAVRDAARAMADEVAAMPSPHDVAGALLDYA
ncbi:UDP:flavonoid glycosyltransferase YjiC (YdhE family) [Saccharothrix ecbatanensis]|uniref:UDP:flavonoid glycosyltransferase YjiC (YdhE family) n=1 Tax=Saccharothrix ecbatanensis TaxID=1105145 RepID=A0A7W9HIQ9_9PSEU|nr:glycosyltransferase [Saccharothrix ecbatanensis]MBB5802880.1 UDP:flavonoid glycosyltransferase YjiC (YdhE family) [Saccharothrix ecbatanensis]